MTKKGELQSRQQIEALFAQRRQVAADAAKELSALRRTEAAGDLSLDFDHAEILFGAIVGKWHPEIGHEPEHSLGIALKAVQEILGLGLFDSSSLLGHAGWGRRLSSQPDLDELMIGCREMVKHLGG